MNTEPITINVYLDNLSKEDREKFLALAEKAKEPKHKIWEPQYEEIIFYIDSDGDVRQCCYGAGPYSRAQYTIGNCFKTRAEAEFVVEKLKVIAELKRFAEEHNDPIDWNDHDQYKYYIRYDNFHNEITIMYWTNVQSTDVAFSSCEIAEQAIKAIEKERLKKYYFEIKENDNA